MAMKRAFRRTSAPADHGAVIRDNHGACTNRADSQHRLGHYNAGSACYTRGYRSYLFLDGVDRFVDMEASASLAAFTDGFGASSVAAASVHSPR